MSQRQHSFRTIVAVLLLSAAGSTTLAQAPEEDQEPKTRPEDIQQQRPSFYVRVDVNRKTRSYRKGDFFSLQIASEQDGYAYVLYKQADGKVYQVFPNVLQPENRIHARQAVQIPSADDQFRWQVGPPYGEELLKVIVSKEPVKALSHPSLRSGRLNPVAPKDLKGVELEMGEAQAPPWGEHEVRLTTYESQEDAAGTGAKRWGVFFGVSHYEFPEVYEVAHPEKKQGLNLPVCHLGARAMAEVMQEIGALNGARVFTNEEATRANVQMALTRWLPSVSKPGDTVLFFFNGHGVQSLDNDGDEQDKIDELLAPYDYLDVAMINVLLAQEKPPPKLKERIERLVAKCRGGTGERQNICVIHETCVSDDIFGHWLQALDGRKVIVILDTCYSGGFASTEKGFGPEAGAVPFDFLDQEVSRLKDIGQRDCVLLAATRPEQVGYVRLERDFTVMTYYLLQLLREAPASVTMTEAFEHSKVQMAAYFQSDVVQKLNERLRAAGKDPIIPHQPIFMNLSDSTFFLKP